MNMNIILKRLLNNVYIALISSFIAVVVILATGTRFRTFSPYIIIPGSVMIILSLPVLIGSYGEEIISDFIERQREEQKEHYRSFLDILKARRYVGWFSLGIGVVLDGIGALIYFASV